MSTVSIDLFRDYVMSFAPTVPRSQIKQAVRNKLIEFCRRTQYWREDIVITPVQDQAAYTLTTSAANTRVAGVKRVVQGEANTEVVPTTQDKLNRYERGWETRKGRLADWYVMDDETSVRIVPIPSIAPTGTELDLTFSVWIQPDKQNGSVVLTEIYDTYLHEISMGAVSELQMLPSFERRRGAPTIADSLSIFEDAVGKARARGERRYSSHAKRRVHMQSF